MTRIAVSKKICMLGAFSVGKTSLVERYVRSIFSDKYLSTVGLKISKKVVNIDGTDVSLVLWDMEGKDDFIDINISYLRGAMGFFVVVDLSRKDTLEVGLALRKTALDILGDDTPNIMLLNKSDLPEWDISAQQIQALETQGINMLLTSAKESINVEEAFESISVAMLRGK